jgi:hypothetical protein
MLFGMCKLAFVSLDFSQLKTRAIPLRCPIRSLADSSSEDASEEEARDGREDGGGFSEHDANADDDVVSPANSFPASPGLGPTRECVCRKATARQLHADVHRQTASNRRRGKNGSPAREPLVSSRRAVARPVPFQARTHARQGQ